jgi:hypothetical protein
MHSKTIPKVNSRKKRKTINGSKDQVEHLDDILNEKLVTVTTRQQSIRSSLSSNSRNTVTITTNVDETSDQAQSTDQTQENTDTLPMKSEVWDYATKLHNGKVKCHKCNREISCKDHSTTGLRRHLQRCLNISKFISNAHRSSNSTINNDMKKKLNELVYKCIIEDGRSFGDLRKPGMARFIEEILPGNWKC